MREQLIFHFEGALADGHRMNFYESARFQYAAARLMVKLAQFREYGRFVQKITNSSNFDIELVTQTDGSFNINVEDPGQTPSDESFIKISLSDLFAFISERLVEKIDEGTLSSQPPADGGGRALQTPVIPATALEQVVQEVMGGRMQISNLPASLQDLVRRRAAETHREQRLIENKAAIARIDFARGQKLIAMSAPLISEMATALRKSADTLQVKSSSHGPDRPVLFLDRSMAQEIETALVDDEITPVLGDITQFNKDNGWGKLRMANELRTISFSIPYDILPSMRQILIDSMKRDVVHLQTYLVRDRGGEIIRMIAVGMLPIPS